MLSFTGFLVLLIAVFYAVFMNYPPPPVSPIVYQWHNAAKYLDYNNYKIFYKDDEYLPSSRNIIPESTLLCLHGFPTSSFDWYKVWPFLRRKFERVITLDFLGFGYSDKPRYHPYSVSEQATIVEQLLKHLSVKRVHILAHDYGDTVAQELLARQLKGNDLDFQILSLCLLNGGIFPSKHIPTWSQKLLRTPVIGTITSKFIFSWAYRFSLSSVFGPKTKPVTAEVRDFWGILRHKEGYRVLGNILTYIDERIEHEERWIGALQKTDVPVHMIYGPADPVNPPPFAEHYKTLIPKPSITVLDENIGHYVQLEAPEEMIQDYFQFLDSLNITGTIKLIKS